MRDRILENKITTELGYSKHDAKDNNSGNSCNRYSEKILNGAVEVNAGFFY